jgi:hypothetical protein
LPGPVLEVLPGPEGELLVLGPVLEGLQLP